ncbi:hypothetical protein NHX12_027396 [Muraenolepis orangiensis]|uniref:Myosin tail domain-containing protein n=1 Tax=Muraenolepis orangiensis TaxID=630683 RepID=A0A9Q0INT4_9TELE|nr:hypothetical protein NHX12_027396 [Muraenolepis orangiensis]
MLCVLWSRLTEIGCHRQLLTSELWNRQEKKSETDQEVNSKCHLQQPSVPQSVGQDFQASLSDLCGRLEELDYQEDALSALRSLLKKDLEGYQGHGQRVLEKPNRAQDIGAAPHSMHGKSEMELENNTQDKGPQSKAAGVTSHPHEPSSVPTLMVLYQSSDGDEELVWRSHLNRPQTSILSRSTSMKNLVRRFSDQTGPVESPPKNDSPSGLPPPGTRSDLTTSASLDRTVVPDSSRRASEAAGSSLALSATTNGPPGGPVPWITVTPPLPKEQKSSVDAANQAGKTKDGNPACADSGSRADPGLGSPDSPGSEEEVTTPGPARPGPNPKYQLLLNHEQGNGLSAKGPEAHRSGGSLGDSPRLVPWETSRLGAAHYRGSLESLASRDWDNMSDRVGGFESPPRAFQSPYSTSMDYNPSFRMSDFKGGMSPATSELNLYSYNSRSTSPVPNSMGNMTAPRTRFSTFDTLRRRPDVGLNQGYAQQVNNMPMRSATLGAPNKRDYIEEITKQLDAIQKRNQFLEAESVEMEKERTQIRFEMRGLLVNNEDLLRTNTQLTNDGKRMREHMIEMERENQTMGERFRQMEVELKQSRDLMVEANTQEYAFNFLQQSLKNKIQDESLEKQIQHAQSMAEKLWLTERQVEELEVDKETRDKRSSELNNTISRLEEELGDAVLMSSQAGAELNLQQKLRDDVQLRVEELEESLLEKDQELQRVHDIVSRLQGEVSGKLSDKEQTLEEEIQLRERLQLQCKQAERTEKMIDLETDLEEVNDSEQRWASKHKRTLEQTELLQQKVIQEQQLSEQLDSEKNSLERQLRDLRLEVEELQSSRVQEDVISKTEGRLKELENTLRTEERNKFMLSNTISKLERKISELSDQMEEEHRISTEQKDLMTQRIRTLKRQLNEAEEETSRKDAQYRHAQRELSEERETAARLQKQLLDQHLQTKRKETMMMRQTLDNLRLDLSVDDEEPLEGEQLAIV